MKISQSEILQIQSIRNLGFETLQNSPITGVSTDSRTTQAGDIFFAIRGEKFDGHDFVTRAIGTGASVVVVDKKWADANGAMLVSLSVPRLVVESTTVAVGNLASVYRKKFDVPIIAVAGSNGKTTTKNMINAVLRTKFNVLSTEGNLNNHIGVPQTLFRLDPGHEAAVVEIGTNHFGELDYLCRILAPTHGIITNIGREHLEFFGSLDGVAKAEGELFEWLKANRGTFFVNKDDERVSKLSKNGAKVKKIGFGFRSAGVEVKGRIVGKDECGCARTRMRMKGKSPFEVQLKVPGEQNARNALAAAAIGLAFKVSPAGIRTALESFSAAGKRMEVIRLNGLVVLNDSYNANPDSVVAALSTMKSMKTAGRRIAVLGDMLELGKFEEREHRGIAKAIAKNSVDCLFTLGERSRFTYEASKVRIKYHFDDKSALSEKLASVVSGGDVVLIKGSRGMKMEDVVAFLQQKFK